jgi:hypothetical protein
LFSGREEFGWRTFEVGEAGNNSGKRTPEGVRQPNDARFFTPSLRSDIDRSSQS